MGIGARNPRYEVVFFDLYGTLIDIRTDEQSEAAWQALYDCVTELGAQYESVDVMRDQFEKLEAREMVRKPTVQSFATGGTNSTSCRSTGPCS